MASHGRHMSHPHPHPWSKHPNFPKMPKINKNHSKMHFVATTYTFFLSNLTSKMAKTTQKGALWTGLRPKFLGFRGKGLRPKEGARWLCQQIPPAPQSLLEIGLAVFELVASYPRGFAKP
jgi:hypothetical protein